MNSAAWIQAGSTLARSQLRRPTYWAVVVATIALQLALRGWLPLAIGSSTTSQVEVDTELRGLLFTGLCILALRATAHSLGSIWTSSSLDLAVSAACSAACLMMPACILSLGLTALSSGGAPLSIQREMVAIPALALLAGILAPMRASQAATALIFLLLVFLPEILGGGSLLGSFPATRSPATHVWSVSAFLPMLVPLLSGLACTCLARALR